MDKVIATALLTIAAVIAAVMVVTAILPSVSRGGSSVISSSEAASELLETDIEIIATNGSTSTIQVWIKNVGAADIIAVNKSDVFLEDIGTTYTRMTYEDPQVASDTWRYAVLDGGTVWKPDTTVRVTITLPATAAGDYEVTFITFNGVEHKESFSV